VQCRGRAGVEVVLVVGRAMGGQWFEGRSAGREGYRNNMVVYGFGNGCSVDGWLSGSAWLSCFALFRMVLKKKENVFLGERVVLRR
jgi:hypothetical protein